MSNRKRCICKGRKPEVLLSAFYARARKRIADGVLSGKPPPAHKELAQTVTLIRALGVGVAEKAPFEARWAHLDLHLAECPCSPNYVAPEAPDEA